jgi:glycerol-1-phosphate dehydrogenase [NAD(P)+]
MFEKSTWIRLPRNVLVGHGVLDQTVEAIEELHLSGTVMVVSSPTPGSYTHLTLSTTLDA